MRELICEIISHCARNCDNGKIFEFQSKGWPRSGFLRQTNASMQHTRQLHVVPYIHAL